MKKRILALTMAFSLVLAGMAFATQPYNPGPGYYVKTHGATAGTIKWFPNGQPENNSEWSFVGTAPPSTPGCTGGNCSASGNYDFNVVAYGNGFSGDLNFVPAGASAGFGSAGGYADADSEGAFETGTFKIFCKKFTIDLGSSEANANVVAGGVTRTNDLTLSLTGFDKSIQTGTVTDNYAIVSGHIDGDVIGLAYVKGDFDGSVYQNSFNTSVLFDSPLASWKSDGFTNGFASQGSFGWISGDGATIGFGDYDVDAEIEMLGGSYSASYRGMANANGWHTETMGTAVGAWTTIDTMKSVDKYGLAIADVDGGYFANGAINSTSFQTTPGGLAKATLAGSYVAKGALGCSAALNMTGYTQTSVSTLAGYNGSIQSAAAGVSISNNAPAND